MSISENVRMSQIGNALNERDAWRRRCEAARAQRDALRIECKERRLKHEGLMEILKPFMGCDCINDTCMEKNVAGMDCVHLEPLVEWWAEN